MVCLQFFYIRLFCVCPVSVSLWETLLLLLLKITTLVAQDFENKILKNSIVILQSNK